VLATVQEAAAMLGRSERVRQIINRRRLEKFYDVSGKHRFRVRWADIEAVYSEIARRGR